MKHKLAAATLLAMINIPHAIAADLPSRNEAYAPAAMEAPVRGYNWNGFYAGVNVGYGWGSFSKGASNLFKSPTGAVLGGQAGFNYQTGSLVTGLEGDLYWSGMSSRRNLAGPISSKGEINWAGSLRARAGFAAERVLVYLTGGVAMGKLSARINDNLIPGIFSSSDTRIGWVAGGGIEYAFTDHISVKTEFLYTSYGSKFILSAPYRSSSKASSSIIRAGVNYHF